MSKYYAVKRGVTPGIYETWEECSAQVKGFKGALYKGFSSEDDAKAFMDGTLEEKPKHQSKKQKADYDELSDKANEALAFLKNNGLLSEESYKALYDEVERNLVSRESADLGIPVDDGCTHVYVDGSWNGDTDEYGYGVYITNQNMKHILYGKGACKGGGRNVEGELMAATKALEYINENMISGPIIVHHDYVGIGEWADHNWSINRSDPETSRYRVNYVEYVDKLRSFGMDIRFEHVKGHTGNEGNEVVDKLAKMGCGLDLTPSECKFIGKYSSVPGYPVSGDTDVVTEEKELAL